MSFGRSIRIAADPDRDIQTRVINLMGSIEYMSIWGFHGTVDRLYLATGAGPSGWTPAQVDRAVELVVHAHASWSAFKRAADAATHESKRRPSYRPAEIDKQYREWIESYLNESRRREWRLLE